MLFSVWFLLLFLLLFDLVLVVSSLVLVVAVWVVVVFRTILVFLKIIPTKKQIAQNNGLIIWKARTEERRHKPKMKENKLKL